MKDSYDFSQGKRGPVATPEGKTRITIYVDNAVLESFRAEASAQGKGYQTLINEALRHATEHNPEPLTVESLRQVLREELRAA